MTGPSRPRVVVGSDSPVILAGLAAALRHEGVRVIGAVSRLDRTLARLGDERVDGLVLATPGAVLDDVIALLDARPDGVAAVVLLPEAGVRVHADAVQANGAVCLPLTVSPDTIAAALGRSRALTNGVATVRESVVRGPGGYLSPRESQTLERVARGETNEEAAAALGVAPETIKTHLRHAFRKLGVRNRTEAVAVFLEAGST